MALAITCTSYLQNLNVHGKKKNGGESDVRISKVWIVIAKKEDVAEQRAVMKFCSGIGKTPTEAHFLKQSENIGM